jgi:hypothetical protein
MPSQALILSPCSVSMTAPRVPYWYAVPEPRVSYPHLLDYSLKVTSRKQWNKPHVTKIHGNDPESSARIYWFPRLCDHPYLPTYFFFISFRVVFLRNDCSVTNRTQLTHWKRTLEMKSVKLTARCLEVVSTTYNVESRYTWWRMVVTSSMWCNVSYFNVTQSTCMCLNNIVTLCFFTADPDPTQTSANLQEHLQEIIAWTRKWKLKINESKSSHISFTLRQGQCRPPVQIIQTNIPQRQLNILEHISTDASPGRNMYKPIASN